MQPGSLNFRTISDGVGFPSFILVNLMLCDCILMFLFLTFICILYEMNLLKLRHCMFFFVISSIYLLSSQYISPSHFLIVCHSRQFLWS